MHTSLQFLAKKSVLLFGVALAVLANPFTYVIISSTVLYAQSADRHGAGFDTHDQFIQTMLLVSSLGFVIIIVSRISTWIVAFQELKAGRSTRR